MAKLEEILPEIRKGQKARRNSWPGEVDWDCYICINPEFPDQLISEDGRMYLPLHDDILADDWELESEPVRVADYLVPTVSQLYVYETGTYPTYFRNTLPIGQQPEGSVMVPGSEREQK